MKKGAKGKVRYPGYDTQGANQYSPPLHRRLHQPQTGTQTISFIITADLTFSKHCSNAISHKIQY